MKVHEFDEYSSSVYGRSQCDDAIADGDVLVALRDRAVAYLAGAWPVAVTAQAGAFDRAKAPDRPVEERYAGSFSEAVRVATNYGWPLAGDPHTAAAELIYYELEDGVARALRRSPDWITRACRLRFESEAECGIDPDKERTHKFNPGNWWDGYTEVRETDDGNLEFDSVWVGETEVFDRDGRTVSVRPRS